MMRESFLKSISISLIVTPILFLLLVTIAMYLYPGGYSLSEDFVFYSPFYRFKLNYLSDLGMLETAPGWSNIPSAILFCISMTLPGLAFIFHSIFLPNFFSDDVRNSRKLKIAMISGIICSVGFIGVGFTPWDVLPLLHNLSVLVGFGLSPVYCLFFGLTILKDNSFPKIFGYLSLTLIIVIIVYALVSIFAPPYDTFPGRITHVIAQKVVTFYMMILIIVQGIGSLILIKKNENK